MLSSLSSPWVLDADPQRWGIGGRVGVGTVSAAAYREGDVMQGDVMQGDVMRAFSVYGIHLSSCLSLPRTLENALTLTSEWVEGPIPMLQASPDSAAVAPCP